MARPTIKGIFVNSHIKALRAQKGEAAVKELERRFGKPLTFSNSENVLIADEVLILRHCVALQSDTPVAPEHLEEAAGTLHFQNFSTTPLAKIILPFFKQNFKALMLNSPNIAGHVFQGVDFESKELGEKKVQVIMRNNDYHIDHFKGLFTAWMKYSNLSGTVTPSDLGNGVYQYVIEWN